VATTAVNPEGALEDPVESVIVVASAATIQPPGDGADAGAGEGLEAGAAGDRTDAARRQATSLRFH
jgi:hypothetical protein